MRIFLSLIPPLLLLLFVSGCSIFAPLWDETAEVPDSEEIQSRSNIEEKEAQLQEKEAQAQEKEAQAQEQEAQVPEQRLPLSVLEKQPYNFGQDTVIGRIRYWRVRRDESLIEIARTFKLGFNRISASNPGVDSFLPPFDMQVVIPTEWVLPEVKVREGIVINIPEMRLFFFPSRNARHVFTFPIGIGDDGNETPTGNFTIIEKIVKPSWHVPKSIKNEDPELPNVVPPGPENPLGTHALRLSERSILIHGTNRPWGIGRKVSHGCIQLYPEDIMSLYQRVKKGTPVCIVRQPVKVGTRGDKVYVEIHDDGKRNYMQEVLGILGRKNLLGRVNPAKLRQAVAERNGIPIVVSE